MCRHTFSGFIDLLSIKNVNLTSCKLFTQFVWPVTYGWIFVVPRTLLFNVQK